MLNLTSSVTGEGEADLESVQLELEVGKCSEEESSSAG